jgi:hypothetical protein
MYSRFLEEVGRPESALAAEAAADWTRLAEAARDASESETAEPRAWSRLSELTAEVLDAETRLWSALSG